MATGVSVSAQDAIQRVQQYIAAGDDAGAVEYGREVMPALLEIITPDEMYVIGGLLSSAERAISYATYERSRAHAASA